MLRGREKCDTGHKCLSLNKDASGETAHTHTRLPFLTVPSLKLASVPVICITGASVDILGLPLEYFERRVLRYLDFSSQLKKKNKTTRLGPKKELAVLVWVFRKGRVESPQPLLVSRLFLPASSTSGIPTPKLGSVSQ